MVPLGICNPDAGALITREETPKKKKAFLSIATSASWKNFSAAPQNKDP